MQKKLKIKTLKKKIRKANPACSTENQKELEKTSRECLTENSMLKKKIYYWSTKCKKLESTEDVTLSTKIKVLYNQRKFLKN